VSLVKASPFTALTLLVAIGCGAGETGGQATDASAGQDGSPADGRTIDAAGHDATPLGDAGSGATVIYVGKITDVTDFSAATGLDLGKYGYYFPQFGQSTPKSKRTAKDNMRFSKPAWQGDWEFKVFEQCGGKPCNLFSPDAGLFDVTEG